MRAEFNKRPPSSRRISMARSADPDSAGSQFFVCLRDASHSSTASTRPSGTLTQGDDVLGKLRGRPDPHRRGRGTRRPVDRQVSKVAASSRGPRLPDPGPRSCPPSMASDLTNSRVLTAWVSVRPFCGKWPPNWIAAPGSFRSAPGVPTTRPRPPSAPERPEAGRPGRRPRPVVFLTSCVAAA